MYIKNTHTHTHTHTHTNAPTLQSTGPVFPPNVYIKHDLCDAFTPHLHNSTKLTPHIFTRLFIILGKWAPNLQGLRGRFQYSSFACDESCSNTASTNIDTDIVNFLHSVLVDLTVAPFCQRLLVSFRFIRSLVGVGVGLVWVWGGGWDEQKWNWTGS